MEKTRIAEWLLAKVSSSQRAAEVVGDLLEQRTSSTQFWLTIARVWVALTWRWILGAVLASAAFFVVLAPYSVFVTPGFAHPHYEPGIVWAMYLAAAAVCFGTNTGMAVARYGLRDRGVWMSAAIWATLIVCACCIWVPRAPVVMAVLLTCGAVGLLAWGATRRLVLSVLGPTAAFAVTYAVFIVLARATSIPHTSATAVPNVIYGIVSWLTSVAVEGIVLARLRPALLGRA